MPQKNYMVLFHTDIKPMLGLKSTKTAYATLKPLIKHFVMTLHLVLILSIV